MEDNNNYCEFLQGSLGGNWKSSEIKSLHNPIYSEVSNAIGGFMSGADYTFILFSGHGYINTHDNQQRMEITGADISISDIRTSATRQTLVIDTCRGYYTPETPILKASFRSFEGLSEGSTREIFNRAVMNSESGLTILYAASENQTALDTAKGGAYLLSLLKVAEGWEKHDRQNSILPLKNAHHLAIQYLRANFDTIQKPVMNMEKRIRHFPFAVKYTRTDWGA